MEKGEIGQGGRLERVRIWRNIDWLETSEGFLFGADLNYRELSGIWFED